MKTRFSFFLSLEFSLGHSCSARKTNLLQPWPISPRPARHGLSPASTQMPRPKKSLRCRGPVPCMDEDPPTPYLALLFELPSFRTTTAKNIPFAEGKDNVDIKFLDM